MVRLILAGLALAFAASGATVYPPYPAWEGHAGTLNIKIFDNPNPGQGNVIEQFNYNFIVGAGPEIPDAVNGAMYIDIADTYVRQWVFFDHYAPRTEFTFALNGTAPAWFSYHFNWPDVVMQNHTGSLYLAPNQIPEPSTYGLMAAGLGVLALFRRRLTGRGWQ